jgi:23S rRNA pseudouridine1911/1915/1917 synthase
MPQSVKSGPPPSGGERLDLYLVRQGHAVSRRQARELIAAGRVLVNGYRCRKGRGVTGAELVEVVQSSRDAPALAPNPELPLEVLYQDPAILIVNKPGLLPSHPLREGETATLMNAVAARFPQAAMAGGKPLEGGLVHRLDNGTSGAIMVALTNDSFTYLRSALRKNEIGRCYLALVEGALERSLELNAPVAHHPGNRRKMTVVDDPGLVAKLKARPAATLVKPIRRIGRFTLVEVTPRTGNRHQIRVHLAAAGFGLAGDGLYGGPPAAALPSGRFFLHLAELRIPQTHGRKPAQPVTRGEPGLVVKAPLPADLQATIVEFGG